MGVDGSDNDSPVPVDPPFWAEEKGGEGTKESKSDIDGRNIRVSVG